LTRRAPIARKFRFHGSGNRVLAGKIPEFDRTMAVFESLNRRYRNTLRELAK
jgi:hypothetical protein